jgi:hypothetical protein
MYSQLVYLLTWPTVGLIGAVLAVLGSITHEAWSDAFPVVALKFQFPALPVG